MAVKQLLLSLSLIFTLGMGAGEGPQIDLSGYSPDCDVKIGENLVAVWEAGSNGAEPNICGIQFNWDRTHPLISCLKTIPTGGVVGKMKSIGPCDPSYVITVGTRTSNPGRPPEQTVWNTFFDNPASRPFKTFTSSLDVQSVRVTSRGKRATISISKLEAGAFSGELQITMYAGSELVLVEAVISTEEDNRAILYDAGLIGRDKDRWKKFAWTGMDGKLQTVPYDAESPARPLEVKYRTLAAETEDLSISIFPPPHQFFYPIDWTNNLKNVWLGKNYSGTNFFGLGIRHEPKGAGNFVPWFNAPPNTQQRLGFFMLLNNGNAESALKQAQLFTHSDRFPDLPGHITFTTHYHMAIAMDALDKKAKGVDPLPIPEWVKVFKDMNVNAIHLGEFHGDGHQNDPGPLRLKEMESMFSECKRLSDDKFLVIPGEESSDFLGLKEKGKHPGHWMSFFPKPVYWIQRRNADQPFVEDIAPYGRVYRVGARRDMMDLLERENALAWSAHPRIKASSWTPDIFRKEDFYLAPYWLGAAYKSMPGDCSRERLGDRCLDLLSDMSNWGQKKYMPGEVDVFKIDHRHELYGHMNINYLRLDKVPRYEDGWQPISDALQNGKFFVTTGEILIRKFEFSGKQSGETATVKAGDQPELVAELEWTFPLKFAEVISGDGEKTYRERIDLSDTTAFGKRTLKLKPDVKNRKWLRLEVWDIATDGAFTQPVWINN